MSCIIPGDVPWPHEAEENRPGALPRVRLGPPIERPTRRDRTRREAHGTSVTYPNAGLTLVSDRDRLTIRVDDYHAGPVTIDWSDLDRLRALAARNARG